MTPELIADYECVVGEGPMWHPLEKRLYWGDILTGRLFRYDPVSRKHEQIYCGDVVGGFTVQADGALLLFGEKGRIRIWREGALTTVVDEIPADRDTRFNDVIADPEGRVFCGTMPVKDRPASLYRLDPDGTLTKVLDDVGLSNGMGFTPDLRQIYYSDTAKMMISLFDYDRGNGALSNQRVFARVPRGEGAPDGMTVDAEGYVWSARWGGGVLVRYAPDGQIVDRVAFPALKVSSAMFGGDDYGDLYVTTAGGDQKATDGAGAGALFRLRPGVKGRPEFLSRVGIA